MKNLKNKTYPERIYVNTLIDTLLQDAKENAYLLSMPLLASAQQGDEKTYSRILPKIKKAIELLPEEKLSFKAWLTGRILLAADNIGDRATFAETQKNLHQALEEKTMPKDAFSTWALGYLAGSDKQEYVQAKQNITQQANALTQAYQAAKEANKTSKDDLQDLLSAALWADVMNAQAATNANDKDGFQYFLNQIKTTTQQPTISLALSNGLLRTSASNDYPAWALSIVYLAAVKFNNTSLTKELSEAVKTSIKQGKAANANAEVMLAIVNKALTTTLHSVNQQPASNSCQIL